MSQHLDPDNFNVRTKGGNQKSCDILGQELKPGDLVMVWTSKYGVIFRNIERISHEGYDGYLGKDFQPMRLSRMVKVENFECAVHALILRKELGL